MPEAPMLRAEQQAFLEELLGRTPRSPEQRRARLRVPAHDELETRLHIYASGLPARVAEALENDFPAAARILGPGALRSLAAFRRLVEWGALTSPGRDGRWTGFPNVQPPRVGKTRRKRRWTGRVVY